MPFWCVCVLMCAVRCIDNLLNFSIEIKDPFEHNNREEKRKLNELSNTVHRTHGWLNLLPFDFGQFNWNCWWFFRCVFFLFHFVFIKCFPLLLMQPSLNVYVCFHISVHWKPFPSHFTNNQKIEWNKNEMVFLFFTHF